MPSVPTLVLSIPVRAAVFIDAPFCDTDSAEVSGCYVVWTELIPMDLFMHYRACPWRNDTLCRAEGDGVVEIASAMPRTI